MFFVFGKMIMGVIFNRIFRFEVKFGDYIYFWRLVYMYVYYGIYVGDDKVIYFICGWDEELGIGIVFDVFLISLRLELVIVKCDKCGMEGISNGVVLFCLDCFFVGCLLYWFEYNVDLVIFFVKVCGGICILVKLDIVEVVLYWVNYFFNNGFGLYYIFYNNCEDFVIYCKMGLLVIECNMIGWLG